MNTKTSYLTLVLRHDLKLVSWTALMFRGFCELVDCPPGDIVRLELALVEALNNIFLHGSGGRADLEVKVSMRREEESLVIELSDNGEAIPDININSMPDPLCESSRGLPLIHACVDHVIYGSNNGVNVLLMKKTLPVNPAMASRGGSISLSGQICS
jgi:serine/threonine-protein kinase RsbW